MEQTRIVEWLTSGGPWNRKPDVVETHAAYVFLVGERAFKLKKAVNFGYLDFSTLQKRKQVLDRELKLNRRTAHDMYLRVLPVTDLAGKLEIDGRGTAIDYVLEMKRFAPGSQLSELAEQRKLDVPLIEKFAHQIASYHAEGETIFEANWPEAFKRITDENMRDFRSLQIVDPATLEHHAVIRDRAFIAASAAINRQSKEVRRCHGDLHLANAYVERGRPILFDCIEFDDFYAQIPPLYDLSFLIMDLIARGLFEHANRALNVWLVDQPPQRWRTAMEDLAALPAYLTVRAEIRAKAEARKEGGKAIAKNYFELASVLAESPKPSLIAIGGLSGTGKSTLGRALAPTLGRFPGAVHLRTDEIRKRQAAVSFDTRLPPSAYSAERAVQVYAAMDEMARAALKAGHAVVADAVFARQDERSAVRAIAQEAHVPFIGFWLEAPSGTLEARLSRRTGDASDADAGVLKKQQTFDLGPIDWHRLDASGGAQATTDAARKVMGTQKS